MTITLTKTDYILWRECKKNVWLKIHKPEIYNTQKLSEFEKQIIETGNEVELVARQLFPSGILIEGRAAADQEKTQDLLNKKTKIIFQPIFVKENFLAAVDILELNSDGTYTIYEVKSTTDVDKKTHYHDLAFQIILLEKCGLHIKKANLIHLNSEYMRQGEVNIHPVKSSLPLLNSAEGGPALMDLTGRAGVSQTAKQFNGVNQLFKIEDVTEVVETIKQEVIAQMPVAQKYIAQSEEPPGYCDCLYKGRSNHCSTFAYSNPKVPAYGVHDISRIGASRAKLQDLIDVGIFELKDVPDGMDFSLAQQNQITAHVQDIILQDRPGIKKELESLVFPLYFLDYETFPSAIPRFDGFSPYQQIPFQYSLYVLAAPDMSEASLKHFEFIFTEKADPSAEFLKSLQKNIGTSGSIIVWNKKFECKINSELATRIPSEKLFIDMVNARVYDLMDVFGKQLYVHKDFKGKISIKNVLPVLVPELSYKKLNIQEGGSASQRWNEAVTLASPQEKETIITDLKEYCKLDTYAMYAIWKHLRQLVF